MRGAAGPASSRRHAEPRRIVPLVCIVPVVVPHPGHRKRKAVLVCALYSNDGRAGRYSTRGRSHPGDFVPRTPLHARSRGPRCPAPLAWLTRSRSFAPFKCLPQNISSVGVPAGDFLGRGRPTSGATVWRRLGACVRAVPVFCGPCDPWLVSSVALPDSFERPRDTCDIPGNDTRRRRPWQMVGQLQPNVARTRSLRGQAERRHADFLAVDEDTSTARP
jgi:hypothetical protein